MRTIGLIGGTGWVSTAEYYRIINEETNRRRGGLEFAKCILYSLNYGDVDRCNQCGDREGILKLLLDASGALVMSGADCILVCANTFHQFAEMLERSASVPLLHIAEAAAAELKKKGLHKVGLLGTKQTMEMDFYVSKLRQSTIEVLTPESSDREFIQQTITHELLLGVFREESRNRFLDIMNRLHRRGAEGMVLACTEIPLLIKQEQTDLPLVDTLVVHAIAAVDFALAEG
jgi:aspartate racemase